MAFHGAVRGSPSQQSYWHTKLVAPMWSALERHIGDMLILAVGVSVEGGDSCRSLAPWLRPRSDLAVSTAPRCRRMCICRIVELFDGHYDSVWIRRYPLRNINMFIALKYMEAFLFDFDEAVTLCYPTMRTSSGTPPLGSRDNPCSRKARATKAHDQHSLCITTSSFIRQNFIASSICPMPYS